MERSEYIKKFQDPRWQRKRLQIMERDNFKCRDCDSKDETLSVHHSYYVKGRSPWHYPEFSLVTLCKDCHKLRHDWESELPEPELSEWELVADMFLAGDQINSFNMLFLAEAFFLAHRRTGNPAISVNLCKAVAGFLDSGETLEFFVLKEIKERQKMLARAASVDDFTLFYTAYPRKQGKQSALKAWLKSGITYAEIKDRLEAFKVSDDWRKDDGKYIPMPATWINGKRWEDELLVPVRPQKSRGQCIGEAGQRYALLENYNDWPKRADGSNQTPDEVGDADWKKQLLAL